MEHTEAPQSTRRDATLDEKYEHLQRIFRELQSVAVAFSAGVDSTLILKVAVDTLGPDKVVAVTGRSDSLAHAEFEQARELAAEIGVEHVVVDTSEFENPDYLSNPTNRCYYCKTTLYEHLDRFIVARGLAAVVSGVNADDLGDYRPGLEAGREHNVRNPAADAGFTKADVRELSKRLGLPTYDKPASPCLSSRVQYGEEITPEKLRRIEACEAFLRSLGFRECRVRHHNNLARVEVEVSLLATLMQPHIAARIDSYFRAQGYAYVTLDLRGFRSGSMNEVISLTAR